MNSFVIKVTGMLFVVVNEFVIESSC